MFRRKQVLGVLGVLSLLLSHIPPLSVFTPVAMAAPTALFFDGFGTGSTDPTFNEAPVWTEGSNSGNDAEKRASGSGNDSTSPNGSRFAVIFGKDGYICTAVDTTGYDSIELSYYWRGDNDAESDSGIVELKSALGGDCDDSSGWTELQNHNLGDDSSWSTQPAFTNAGFDNTPFLLRFRTSSSYTNEHFRVDGVLVTGEEITGTLRVIKNTVGGNDTFNFTGAENFPITTSGGSGTHDITDLEAGTYSVDETPPAGWQVANNGCQDVSVTAGETTDCTITNTKAATVTIVKETDGDDGEFFFEGLEEGRTEVPTEDGEGEETVSVFPPAEGIEYTVAENVPDGWDLTGLSCDGVEAVVALPSASFTLEPGDSVTCTFHNVQRGTLHITKNLINYGDAEGETLQFPILIDGGGSYAVDVEAGESEGILEIPLAPGAYGVSEGEIPDGWMLEENGCAEVEIEAGEITQCTITNKKESRIVIHKTAIGALGTFHYTGLNGETGINVTAYNQEEGGSDHFIGDSFFDVFVDVAGQEFTISEELDEGSLWVNTGEQSTCGSFLLLPGETESCYFENTKKATIIVMKETTGGDGTFTVSSNSDGIGSFNLTTTEGQAERSFRVLVNEDTTFTFEETGLPDEWVGSPDHCQVTVGPGDTAICPLGNIKKARLIIEKETIGGDGTFSFLTNGFIAQECGEEECNENEFPLVTESGSAETFFDLFVDGESLEVSITEQEQEGWQAVGASSCSFTLQPGEVETCSFVNAKAARLTVTKTTTGGTGTFHFTGIGGEGGFDLTTLEPNLTVSSFFDVFVDSEEGTTYTVTETLQEGWGTTPESCTVTLHPGEEETCSFENSALRPLTLLAGRDLFETPAGTSTFPLPALPEDFFGPGCSPFSGEVQLGGAPTDPTNLGDTDTVVRRLEDASLPAPGSSDTVPIELVALSLQSVEPIQVHCGGEEPSTSFWDVTVTLPESSQPQGQMTIRRTVPAGGTFDSELSIRPLFTFRHTTDGTTRTYDTTEDSGPFLTLATEGRPWLAEPCPSDMLRVPGVTTNFCPSAESDGRVSTRATDDGAEHRYLPTGVAEAESEGSSSSSAALPGDNDGESGGAGSGHGSRASFAKARFLALFHGVGELPPGAFGAGPEVPLAPEELTFICSMQRSLPPIPPPGLVEIIGAYMAGLMGRDPAFIVEQLQDPFLCESINISLRLVPQTVAKANIPFPVGMDGIPLSRNPSWNACIRGHVTLDVIRNNPDRDEDGRPQDCASYSTEDVWRHPDLGIHFVFHRSPLKIELPSGYVLWKLQKGGI